MMFLYHTLSLLQKFYPEIADMCWRFDSSGGYLFYLFWECLLIQPFWADVNTLIYNMFDIQVPMDPLTLLLNVSH